MGNHIYMKHVAVETAVRQRQENGCRADRRLSGQEPDRSAGLLHAHV